MNIIDKKCKYIAYINAETEERGEKEFFYFNKATLLSGLTFEKFLKMVKEGLIVYDYSRDIIIIFLVLLSIPHS